MGCCAGKRSVNVLARLKYLNVVERSFSTCRARVPVVSRLGVCGSYSPVFRRYASAAAVAAKPNVQYGSPIDKATKEPRGPITEQFIDDQLMRLDRQVQSWGRVDQEQVHELLHFVKRAGACSTQQAVMLTRCTGSLLVKHTPEERVALCDQVCSVLQSLGTEFNIQLYNALLRVKLENGEAFVPAEVLNDIEVQKQLVPNRITYQLLLSRFCDTGDVEGARKILEYMKSQNLMLNETIFNALVKGHIKKGDTAGAHEVMASMKEVGLEPTGDTYTVLMCDLAEKGDISGIEKVLSDARADVVTVTPRHLFSVILGLMKGGHLQHVGQMLKYVTDQQDYQYNHDALNCMFQLVAHGHDDAALQVFWSLHGASSDRNSNVLLRNMVIRERPIDKLIETWKQLKAADRFVDSLEPIAYWCLRYQSTDYCLEFLEKMKSMGFAVKPHYLAPLLKSAGSRGDTNGISRILKHMLKHASEADGSLLGVINQMAVAELLNSGQSLDVILNCLKDAGVNEDQLQILKLSGLVHEGKLTDTARLIEDGVKFSPGIFKSTLAFGLTNSNFDVAGLGELMASINKRREAGVVYTSFNSGVLLSILKYRRMNSDVAQQIVQEWCKHNLKLLPNFKEPLSFDLRRLQVSEDEIEKMQPLYVSDRTSRVDSTNEELRGASVEQLESWVEDAKKNNPGGLNKLEFYLLNKYCVVGAVDKASEVKAQLDARGFVYTAESLSHLANLSAEYKHDLDEALNYKQQLENEHPSYYLVPELSMNIAYLQLTKGQFADALDSLKDHAKKYPQSLQRSYYGDGYVLEPLCGKLVSACCAENDVSQAIELISVLFDCGYVKPGTFRVLETLIDGYLKKSDIDSSLTAMEYCVKHYNKVPSYSSILKLLIDAEDADRLQKAIDLVSTVVGDHKMHLDLVKEFVECGKLKQARRLVEAPGLKADMEPLLRSCEYFINVNKEKELTHFIDVTKHLSGVDRSQMMLQLMRLHARNKDMKKLMDVFSLYEEEQVLPKANVLRYAAKVLESAGEPVPFKVPVRNEEKRESMSAEEMKISSLSDIERLGQHDADTDAELELMTADTAVAAAKKMLRQRHHMSFRNFLKKLVAVGNSKCVAAVEQCVISARLRQHTAMCLMHAHLNNNTLEEFLDKFEKAPAGFETYLSSGMLLATAETQPTLINKLESLAMKCAEETKSRQVCSCLYNFYLLTEQMDKVKQLLQKFDGLKAAVGLSYVTRHAYRQHKEEVLRNVISLHRNDRGQRLTFPYNYLLLLKCDLGVWSDAVQCYNDALDDGLMFDSLWVRSLQALQSLAVTNDQPVPWPAGALEKRMTNVKEADNQRHVDDIASSSDSSDSSSDDAVYKS